MCFAQVGNEQTARMTYADVIALIDIYAQRSDQCMITVNSNVTGKERERERESERFFPAAGDLIFGF